MAGAEAATCARERINELKISELYGRSRGSHLRL